MLNQERKNLLRLYLLRPGNYLLFLQSCFSLSFYFLKRLFVRLKKWKGAPIPQRNHIQRENIGNVKRIGIPDLKAGGESVVEKVLLASTYLELKENLDWGRKYHDNEDIFALHRFGWLLTMLMQNPVRENAERAIGYIQSWIAWTRENEISECWESYSVSERLANLPVILNIVDEISGLKNSDLILISDSLTEQIEHLLSNIEDHGELTNNHILNNARGLYIGGIFLNIEAAIIKGKELFVEWTDKLFHEDGMLKEHSSHYQFVLAYRYEQVALLAEAGSDKEFSEFISSWAKIMNDSASFFVIYGTDGHNVMPLIGDVSPDFPPEWFLNADAGGWTRYRQIFKSPYQYRPPEETITTTCCGFYRIQKARAVLFTHCDNDYLRKRGHGHYDLGSCVLFIAGKPVLIDPGRYRYINTESHGVDMRWHSTVTLDDLGPQYDERLALELSLPSEYKTVSARAECFTDSYGHVGIILYINGFKRLKSSTHWTRTYLLTSNSLTIKDEFTQQGTTKMNARFHFTPTTEVLSEAANPLGLVASGINLIAKRKCQQDSTWKTIKGTLEENKECMYFQRYGSIEPGFCLSASSELRGDSQHIYELNWK